MPYAKMEDVPESLRGIDPPITLTQANEIAACADAMEGGEGVEPWAVCIANFKKSYEVEDGKWVKKEEEKKSFDSNPLAVKALREEDGGVVVGGPLLLWGDPTKKDLQQEYFTPETWLGLNEYKSVPALFHHGLDEQVGVSVIGRRVKAEVRDTGVWVEDWLDQSSAYWKMVKPLLDAEVLYYSPGSAPHLVRKEENGELKSYPVIEDTLTPIPAQHRLRPIEQIKTAYKSAGLDLPTGLEGPEQEQDSGDGEGSPCWKAIATAWTKATLTHIGILEQEDK
jgi:hypothetical protein